MAIIVFLVFLMLAIAYCLFFGPIKKFTDSISPTRIFSVSAEGKVTVSPDIAKVSFAVVSEGSDPEAIAQENIQKMNAAIDFVKSQGIDEKDIKTVQYNLSPRYEYDEDKRTTFISGYTLTQNVLVKVRDLSKVTEILAGLPGLGINQIGSISFEVDDPETYLVDARNQAFEKTRKKAEEMASKNGVQLAEVVSFSEWSNSPVFSDSVKGYGAGEAMSAPAVLPQIQPGTEEVTVQVSVTYAIK